MARVLVVLPCYNEARRLPGDELIGFVRARPEVGFLLVNDGSTDETLRVLQRTEEKEPEHFEVLDLPRNVGKAETVRRAMVRAFSREPGYCGYFDADLSAPLSEIPRLAECLDAEAEREVVLGVRIALLGKQITRSPLRHYLGRVFATAASNVLNLPV